MNKPLFLIVFGIVACVPSVWASDSNQAESSGSVPDSLVTLREVSVSAFKQSENMWVRPLAVTTVRRPEIERLNIVTMKGVSELTPNFFMPQYGSRMTSSVYVRGLGARIDQPVVGLNVDNVPILNKDNYDFDLVDIERIEVLRGPQSTLFGRNTMGGQINISTISPLAYQGVRGLAEYGNGNAWKASVSAYGMISDGLGMGASAYMTASDGFYRNELTGKKVDVERQGSFRWKTSWRPDGNFALDNTFSVTASRQGGYPYASLKTGIIAHNDTCFYRRTGITEGLSARLNVGSVSLAAVSAFQYIDDNLTLDQDFLPLDYFTLTQKRHEWAFSEDIVAKGKSGAYEWLGGIFGFWRSTRMWAPVTFKKDGIENLITGHRNQMMPDYPMRWDDDSFVLHSDFRSPTRGLALYHTSSLDLGRWSFSAGIRLDMERVSLDYYNKTQSSYTIYHVLPDGREEVYSRRPVDISYRGKLNKSFTELLPRLSVSYRLADSGQSMIYATVSKGYKAGGYNTQMFSDVLQQRLMAEMGMSAAYDVEEIISYKPEISWNYEAGAHIRIPSARVEIEGAAFYIDCRDQQLTMFPPGTVTGRIMTNAAKTRSYGLEISGNYNPTDAWRFNVAWGYTHATFGKYNNGRDDFKSNRLPYAPSHTLFAGVTFRTSAPGSLPGDFIFNINLRGVGDIYWDDENNVRQPFYVQTGASAEWSRGNVSVQLWGENIFDTRFDTFYFVSVGNAFVQRGNPARFGATLRLNFDLSKN